MQISVVSLTLTLSLTPTVTPGMLAIEAALGRLSAERASEAAAALCAADGRLLGRIARLVEQHTHAPLPSASGGERGAPDSRGGALHSRGATPNGIDASADAPRAGLRALTAATRLLACLVRVGGDSRARALQLPLLSEPLALPEMLQRPELLRATNVQPPRRQWRGCEPSPSPPSSLYPSPYPQPRCRRRVSRC